MRSTIHHDLWIGSLMCLVSAVLLMQTGKMPSGAAQFPKVILGCFIAFGLWIVYKGIAKTLLLTRGLAKKSKTSRWNCGRWQDRWPACLA